MENKTIKFEILTPEQTVLKDEIKQVSVPTREGEITVLPGHIPLIAILAPGVIEILNSTGEKKIMSVSGGFLEVLHDKIVILADTAERAEDIDIQRAEEAKQRAEETKKDIRHFDHEKFASLSASIAKELARSHAAKKWKKHNKLD